jgi:hypothetical protein
LNGMGVDDGGVAAGGIAGQGAGAVDAVHGNDAVEPTPAIVKGIGESLLDLAGGIDGARAGAAVVVVVPDPTAGGAIPTILNGMG